MSVLTGGFGGGGVGTVNALSGATTGAAVAVLPQLGVLPKTGGVSILVLATVAAAIAVVVSHVGTKLYQRFN